MIRINSVLSHFVPKWIITCAQTALTAHNGIGYNSGKLIFVPNGYPIDILQPDHNARFVTRAEFAVQECEVLLGMIARLDPHKDHLNLLNALAILKLTHSFKCLLVGKSMGPDSPLRREIVTRGLDEQILLVGQRGDIPAIMNALDICVNSSCTEAFPNALCEAMACGTPCVATDVGDSAYIIGDTGWCAPAGTAELLAFALDKAITTLPDPERRHAARHRIVEHFSVEKMASVYRSVWLRG